MHKGWLTGEKGKTQYYPLVLSKWMSQMHADRLIAQACPHAAGDEVSGGPDCLHTPMQGQSPLDPTRRRLTLHTCKAGHLAGTQG